MGSGTHCAVRGCHNTWKRLHEWLIVFYHDINTCRKDGEIKCILNIFILFCKLYKQPAQAHENCPPISEFPLGDKYSSISLSISSLSHPSVQWEEKTQPIRPAINEGASVSTATRCCCCSVYTGTAFCTFWFVGQMTHII